MIGSKFFLANLIAGDISQLELFLLLISFMYLKTVSVETNSDLKLKEFLNLSLIFLILLKVFNFFSSI